MPEGTQINRMFAGIAGRYDRANHILSGGCDVYWRRRLVRRVVAEEPRVVVDLATGSGDVAFALARALGPAVRITGMDFCEPMLEQARAKQSGSKELAAVTFSHGDCMDLPLAGDSVDVATIAFGVRNFEDRSRGLRELLRILRPGGCLCILEFSQPGRWLRPLYYAYLKTLLPRLAKGVTGNRDAYEYLVGSIETFPTCAAMAAELTAAGFSRVHAEALTFGTVAIHRGYKGDRK